VLITPAVASSSAYIANSLFAANAVRVDPIATDAIAIALAVEVTFLKRLLIERL
jgi:hypothetical protein